MSTGLRIGITMGDPSGIGPELIVRVLGAAPAAQRARVTVYGCPTLFAGLAFTAEIP